MEYFKKFTIAIRNLKPDAQYSYKGDTPTTEELFNEVEWVIGIKQNGTATLTKTNPHSELTWDKVNAEMDRLQTEYDAQDYARNRQREYPSIQECVHAILDDDLDNLQVLRQAVKEKFPKNE
jgi:hypothetical protein